MVTLFFFNQKTAYKVRISDWSADVCSTDLDTARAGALKTKLQSGHGRRTTQARSAAGKTDVRSSEGCRRLEALPRPWFGTATCPDRTSTRLNSSHYCASRMPSRARTIQTHNNPTISPTRSHNTTNPNDTNYT